MFNILSPNEKLDNVVYDISHFKLDQNVNEHTHDCIEMVFVVSGNAVQIINGKRESVYGGCITIIHPGCTHGFEKVKSLELYNISCVPNLLENLGVSLAFFRNKKNFFEGENGFSSLRLIGMTSYDILSLIATMFELYHDKNDQERHFKLRSFFSILLILLIQNYKPAVDRKCLSLDELIVYIDSSYQEKLSLSDLAKKNGMSVARFQVKFKEKFGISPMKYLQELRLKHGRELVDTTDLSIKIIAEKTGFYDSNYFIKVFSDKFGVSPRKWREQNN